MNSPIILTFAGPIGSGKTPIAHYLSFTFDLPIYSNDVTRTEITEDLLHFDQESYLKLRDQRIKSIIENKKSFILDASIDREWKNYLPQIKKSQYKIFIISLDLSRDFLLKQYEAKNYKDIDTLEKTIKDHENFLKEFGDIVSISINDQNFKDRLKTCEESFRNRVSGRKLAKGVDFPK